LTEIGFVTTGTGVTVLDADGKQIKLDHGGWDHFAGT